MARLKRQRVEESFSAAEHHRRLAYYQAVACGLVTAPPGGRRLAVHEWAAEDPDFDALGELARSRPDVEGVGNVLANLEAARAAGNREGVN